jgi:diadenylate cyclase
MLPVVRWHIVADFIILTVAFYALLCWARSAHAMRIALSIVGLRALALLASRLDLVVTSWVLDAFAVLVVLVLLLIFQPELRRAFMQLDSTLKFWPRPAVVGTHTGQAIANAAFALAKFQLGALIVITRRDAIGDLLEGGISIGGEISAELLEAIFQKVSPLHDGAVVITGNRLLRAGVVLPLTKRQDMPSFYGTRHRAAVGLAERCDALVVAVSEERSEVTLMDGSVTFPMEDSEHFAATLEGLLGPTGESLGTRLRRYFFWNLDLKFAAFGLAAVIWGMSFLASGATIRTISIPIEFSNVPSGMEVISQSADTLDIQVQGSPWIMDSVSLSKYVGRFDLKNVHPGWHTLQFHENTLDMPPGITVDRVTPETIRVQVATAAAQQSQGR